MATGPLLLLFDPMSLFNYSHRFLLIVCVQLLPLLFHPSSRWNQEEVCLVAIIKSIPVLMVFLLVVFGVQEVLSQPLSMPNAEGGFRFLPGMMIIGICYYLFSAVLDVLIQPLMRDAALRSS